jgi:hypothetical protein
MRPPAFTDLKVSRQTVVELPEQARFAVSPGPSAFTSTFVIPLLPQACSSEKVRKLVAKVASIVVALEQIKCSRVKRSRRIVWSR